MKQNFIRLNGKLYDASTGKLVSNPNSAKTSHSTSTTTKPKPKINQQKTKPSNLIDGFKRPTRSNARAKNSTTSQKPVKASHETNQQKLTKLKPTPRIKPTHGTPKRATSNLQRTTTLRRSSVRRPTNKPAVTPVNSRKTTGSATSKLQPATTSGRAKNTNPLKTPKKPSTSMRSPSISKFNTRRTTVSAPQPRQATTKKTVTTPSRRKFNDPTIVKPSAPKKPVPAKKTPAKLSPKETLIAKKFAELDAEKAMRENIQTKQKTKLRSRIKFSTVLVSSIIFVTISLYIVYLSVPSIALNIASRRAGFTASLPHYLPSGFKFNNPIQYETGQIVINFKSKSDNRSYSVTQQPSQWDTESVYENYVKLQDDKQPYTIQDSGLTIYIFGNNNAAWVNAGKFFAINGENAQLSTQQLQNIATSL